MTDLLNPAATGTVDDFLAKADELEEAPEAKPEEEEAPLEPIDALLIDFPDAPGRDVIENWKTTFGSVHAFVPNQKECYLFRPLRRMEYKNIANEIARLRETAHAEQDPTIVENQTHERVVQTCILYPKTVLSHEAITMSPAGLYQTLFELIMRNSHFISPEAAMASTYRL